jgi:hypothetical protein
MLLPLPSHVQIVHTNRTTPIATDCGTTATANVVLAKPATDAEVTAKAKLTLGRYPKPWKK